MWLPSLVIQSNTWITGQWQEQRVLTLDAGHHNVGMATWKSFDQQMLKKKMQEKHCHTCVLKDKKAGKSLPKCCGEILETKCVAI